MEKAPLISTHQISVCHGKTYVLENISLQVSKAEIVTIVGPNGSGKSTLLRAMLGILPLYCGTVTRAAGLRVGYAPQHLKVNTNLPITVARFLSLPQKVNPNRTDAILEQVGLNTWVKNQQITTLSGGQLQRVLLAYALLSDPQLLILDEPTQGLDQMGEAQFYKLIEELRTQAGMAVLMVSHDLHVVMAASDRVICLNGHICCEGTPAVVSSAPEYRALFGLGSQGALALYQHKHDHHHNYLHGTPRV